MSVREADFRSVLGRFATGVTVVTTMRDGHPLGITVNAFSSLSLDPPLILICVDRRSYIHDSIQHTGFFAVNLLTEAQRDLATGFAVRSERRDKDFNEVSYHSGITGAPLFDESLGYVECHLVDVFPGGDHSIFVGEVVALDGAEAHPLLYYRARYGAYASDETHGTNGTNGAHGANGKSKADVAEREKNHANHDGNGAHGTHIADVLHETNLAETFADRGIR